MSEVEIIVGIGGYLAGHVVQNEDGSYEARISKAYEIWDGYEGAIDSIPVLPQVPALKNVIFGANDTDEAGYVVALTDEIVTIPLSVEFGEAAFKSSEPCGLTWWSHTRFSSRVGAHLESGGWENPDVFPIPEDGIIGWSHPDQDQ